jgi:hypothetical protein
MAIMAQEESGNVYVVRISGLIKKAEWDAGQAAAAKKWENIDKIMILVVLEDFKGWEKTEAWGDMSFYIDHRDKIKKIAIVGDPKHEDEMMMFSGAGFRPAPVKYFPPAQLELARKWLV